jgi:hypothetical protein
VLYFLMNFGGPLWNESRKDASAAGITILTAVCLAGTAVAQSGDTVSPFIKTRAAIIAISNVEVIDGTGTSVLTRQTVLIDHWKIATVGPTAHVTVPAGATTIDGTSKTLIPGMVGMHEHLFYIPLLPVRRWQLNSSLPLRLCIWQAASAPLAQRAPWIPMATFR